VRQRSQHYVVLHTDTEAVEEDDISDPEYNFMLEDVDDDDEEEEVRNDKATRVSSMLIQFSLFAIFNFQMIDINVLGVCILIIVRFFFCISF